ncbi:Tll0287-like domain-containing protein [Polaribacter aquimarinus]|uniref:Cytochrome c family protein n=1 Tax=Polaribacter aquimarinus TaxID=2100726 RepID=A0A2U2JBB0_9FLAO|nr:DUF3365 domain-containing protein [Polaribacter aquimarinus]PWG05628.1 cytochrome c family protein [Polaribacter aquimarinus]
MKYFIVTFVLFFVFSCQKKQKPSYAKVNSQVNSNHPGKSIMEKKCYVCHNPSASHDNRIAPPMIAIKKHYISSTTTKEEFTKEMQNWIQNPTIDRAKMKGAVRRFGIMPKQYYSKEDIKEIAEYMFEYEIEKPIWFDKHYNKKRGNGEGMGKHQQGNNFKNLPYDERGLKYALTTKAVLGKNLMGKIQKEGTLAALKFCNIKAHPLTDSMSVMYKATIKRISDKPRNPKNLSNLEESSYINIFKEKINSAKDSKPIVIESTNNVKVYYPIKTNSMCIQCHGNKISDIKTNVLAQIDKLYPKDMATGYSTNQLRGIWSITFKK